MVKGLADRPGTHWPPFTKAEQGRIGWKDSARLRSLLYVLRNYGGQPDRNFAGSHSTSTSRSAKSNGSRPVTKRAKRGTYTRYGVEIDETSTAKSRRRGHKPTNSAWK